MERQSLRSRFRSYFPHRKRQPVSSSQHPSSYRLGEGDDSLSRLSRSRSPSHRRLVQSTSSQPPHTPASDHDHDTSTAVGTPTSTGEYGTAISPDSNPTSHNSSAPHFTLPIPRSNPLQPRIVSSAGTKATHGHRSSSRSPRSLRVSGIPSSMSEGQLRTFIEDLTGEVHPENILALSLAPEPGQNSQVSTLCLRHEPEDFARCTSGKRINITLAHEGKRHELIVDCDFFGMTCLYSCGGAPAVDIIAVTGLSGHPIGSWKSPNGHAMWLRDFLPAYIKDCRILAYGYESKLSESINNSSIQDYAIQFLNSTRAARRSNTEHHRPVIFIGHSLGGLVIVQSLCYAKQPDWRNFEAIATSTAAVYLFGTPLGGLDHKELFTITEGRPNNQLIIDLMPNSNLLRLMAETFASNFAREDVLIVSFYETDNTVSTTLSENGELQRSGDLKWMVNRDSATILSARSNTVPLPGNHSTMVKFTDRSDERFKIVINRLEIGAAKAAKMTYIPREAKSDTQPNATSQTVPRILHDRTFDEKLNRLPHVEQASFHSRRFDRYEGCLEGTRFDLLNEITSWASDPEGQSIYWLVGMAGTGKSTIARTIARNLSDQGLMGASFFFSRGEQDLNESSKFFTTLAFQLAAYDGFIKDTIIRKLDANPAISDPGQGLRQHWKDLILDPFMAISTFIEPRKPCVLVVDALDECTNDEDVELIIKLLGEAARIKGKPLRVLLTSRPETHIRFAFESEMEPELYKDTVLHDIAKDIVDGDIFIYLQDRFKKIQRKKKRLLPTGWPGRSRIDELMRLSDGLFIYAATVCRFVELSGGDPDKSLADIIAGRQPTGMKGNPETQNLDIMYLNILEGALRKSENPEFPASFRTVMGTILTLTRRMNQQQLSVLCGLDVWCVNEVLDLLPAVLDCPTQETPCPIRILHQSFEDFLTDRDRCPDPNFWIDTGSAHVALLKACYCQMLETLKTVDSCGLESPGIDIDNIDEFDKERIGETLPAEIKYILMEWDLHFKESIALNSSASVRSVLYTWALKFFRRYFIGWLEALSLISMAQFGVYILKRLHLFLSLDDNAYDIPPLLQETVYDALRFSQYCVQFITLYPLQIGISGLMFAPRKSVIRSRYWKKLSSSSPWSGILNWKMQSNRVYYDRGWSPLLQIIENDMNVSCIKISPDGHILASGSSDGIVQLWSTATGHCLGRLKGHSNRVHTVVFSFDGKLLASGSGDHKIKLWDPNTKTLLGTLKGHSCHVKTLAFSPDGIASLLASGSDDNTVKLWNPATLISSKTLEAHLGPVNIVVFSPDGKLLASGSDDKTIRLWDMRTEASLHSLEGHAGCIHTLTFSSNGKILASGSSDFTVKLWDPATGILLRSLEGHLGGVNTVTLAYYTNHEEVLASGSNDKTVRLWNITTGSLLKTLRGFSGCVTTLAFLPDRNYLAFGSDDGRVYLWCTTTDALYGIRTLGSHAGRINALAFSPNGDFLASAAEHRLYIRLWGLWDQSLDTDSSVPFGTVANERGYSFEPLFSPDGRLLASEASNGMLRLWNISTGGLLGTLKGPLGIVRLFAKSIAFSPDSRKLAAAVSNGTIYLWDTISRDLLRTLKSNSGEFCHLAFSPDGKSLVAEYEHQAAQLWKLSTGGSVRSDSLEGYVDGAHAVVFSSDGKLLASGLKNNIIALWDRTNGASLRTIEGHSDTVSALVFSPDRTLLASGSGDGTVMLWNLTPTSINRLATFNVHSSRISALAFSHDRSLLASADFTSVALWDVKTRVMVGQSYFTNPLKRMSFSSCGTALNTNKGTIELSRIAGSEVRYMCRQSWWVSYDWISYRGENLIFIPYANMNIELGFYDNVAAGEDQFGRLYIFKLDPSGLPDRLRNKLREEEDNRGVS